MLPYSHTKSRVFQWIGIILILCFFVGGYYYFQVRASTIRPSVGTAKVNTSQNTNLTSGLIGVWSFNGADISGTTAYDRSGNSNDGTLTNGPLPVIGQVGQALNFDGSDDYVTIPDTASLDVADSANFTLTGWFYRDTFTTDDTLIAKSNGQTASDTGYNLYIDDGTDRVTLVANDGTDQYKMESTSVFTATGWHYYTLVWDDSAAGNTKLYVDGVSELLTATGTFANVNSLANALTLRIGSESDNGNPFDGRLDEVRFYNRALSAGEVQSLYALGQSDKTNSSVSQPQGAGRLDSGLVWYWALDDGSGTTATDTSVNGNDGTLNGGALWTTGQIGGAIDLDGVDDYVQKTDTDTLDFGDTDDFTLAGWFSRDTDTADNVILTKRTSLLKASVGYIVYLDATTDQLIFEVSDGNDEYSLASTSTFTVGAKTGWHHFTVVWDQDSSANSEVYIDGVADNATDSGTIGDIGNLSNSVSVGIGVTSLGNNPFDGKIDEIRIYDRTLSPDEISQLYRLTTPTGVDTGLKGYWSFNGQDISGTSAYDRSGARNNGTLANGPIKVPGKIGQALSFDGSDDSVSVADSANIDFNNADFTIAGWFSRASFTTDDTVFAKRNGLASTDDGYLCYIDDSTDTFICEMSEAGGSDEFQIETSSTFTDPTWHHFALVWDDDSATNTDIYIDGAATSATETGAIGSIGDLSNSSPFVLAAESDAGNPFDGKIDEARIYSRALSANEVASLYNQGK